MLYKFMFNMNPKCGVKKSVFGWMNKPILFWYALFLIFRALFHF